MVCSFLCLYISGGLCKDYWYHFHFNVLPHHEQFFVYSSFNTVFPFFVHSNYLCTGANWNAAISTATWKGARLRDILLAAGLTEEDAYGKNY